MGLVRLIGRMLEKNRENRPGNYREIIDGLVSALRSARSSAGRPSETSAGLTRGKGPVPATQATSLVAGGLGLKNSDRMARKRLALSTGGLLGLALITGALGYRAFRSHDDGRSAAVPIDSEPVAAAPAAAVSGTLQVLATPYASIISITDEESRRPLALPGGSTTPMLLAPIPAGRYRVVLKCAAAGGKQVERVISVKPGKPALVAEAFLGPQELLESLE
jgi:hypothetical protein